MERSDKARAFAALHRPGDPLILYNVWDAGSARAVAEAGAKAIATGSWSVAAAQGYGDGERLPLELALANAERVAAAVALPVTIDFEGAYANSAEQAGENVARLAATGAVGCNVEDRIVGGEGLHPVEEQSTRIAAMRRAAGTDFFLNARIDLFLAAAKEAHERLFDDGLGRARAYASAGANGVFVPGLSDEGLIGRFCEASPLPVNIMVWPGTPPLRRLAELGAARISHAGAPWRLAMQGLGQAAGAAHRMEG